MSRSSLAVYLLSVKRKRERVYICVCICVCGVGKYGERIWKLTIARYRCRVSAYLLLPTSSPPLRRKGGRRDSGPICIIHGWAWVRECWHGGALLGESVYIHMGAWLCACECLVENDMFWRNSECDYSLAPPYSTPIVVLVVSDKVYTWHSDERRGDGNGGLFPAVHHKPSCSKKSQAGRVNHVSSHLSQNGGRGRVLTEKENEE